MSIKSNVKELLEEVNRLSLGKEVKICAATKYGTALDLEELYYAGITIMGENRVEALLSKQEELKTLPIEWHFIGTLQTRKVKSMINSISCLHSLDRLKLAKEIQKYREAPLDCFVEVNVAKEESKEGLDVSSVLPFIETLKDYPMIRVVGLMTMAPNTKDESILRETFRTLRNLQEKVIKLNLSYAPCRELSMGMSNDYVIAIEEGSSLIRVGSKLFK